MLEEGCWCTGESLLFILVVHVFPALRAYESSPEDSPNSLHSCRINHITNHTSALWERADQLQSSVHF